MANRRNERAFPSGSSPALAAGCTCPVIDNGRGMGCGLMDDDGDPMFWIQEGCPLHDIGAAKEPGSQP